MSRVEIYAVGPTGDVTFYSDEPHNAHGGAEWIWRHFGEDYGMPFDMFNTKPWWKWASELCRSGAASDDDALVYYISCDWGIISGELIPKAIHALESFYTRHPHSTGDAIIAVLRQIMKDPEVAGVCFNHTSVVADPIWRNWQNWDEDKDEDPPLYNVHAQDDGHWWIPYPARESVAA